MGRVEKQWHSMWFSFVFSVVAGVTVPSDVTVQQDGTATLICRLGSPITGVAVWLEGATLFADKDQVLPDAPAKYSNFEIVNDDTAIGQMDLRINNAQYEDRGTYTCQFGGTPDGSATLEVQVPATSLTIAVNGIARSPDATVIVTTGTQVTLVCTSLGAKPKVTLDWFKGSQPLGPDTETIPSGGEATDTQSTIDSFIPTRADDQRRIECRTVGHISSQSQYVLLNVYYAPVVTVDYSGSELTCSSDANPVATSHKIILNSTRVLKAFTNSPGTETFIAEDGCAVISCNATNSVGTGTATVFEEICPAYLVPEPATTDHTEPQPATTAAGQTTDSQLIPDVGAIVGVVVAVIILVGVAAVVAALLWRRCHRQERRHPQQEKGQDGRGAKVELKEDLRPQGTERITAGQTQPDPYEIPLNPVATSVVYECVADRDAPVPAASSQGVAYGNVGPNLSFPRDLLGIEKELGRGAFGKVLLGTARGIEQAGKVSKVAVKTLKEGADRQARMELLAELDLMKKVGSHPNVVKLLGCCIEKDPVYIIVEYLGKGDLKNVLIGYRGKDPSNQPSFSKSLSRTLLKFARDVGSGMAFISSQKCVHRDLAARNVLVGDDLVCKVSDFGLARDVMNIRIYQRESQGALPMRWMALESLLSDVYTTESDVWSFGVLLWEIITLGARPYAMMKAKTMVSQLQQGYRMPKPQHCSNELYAMMCRCWQKIPTDRPTFQSLHQQLNEMLSVHEDYITLHKLDESIYEVTMTHGSNEKL